MTERIEGKIIEIQEHILTWKSAVAEGDREMAYGACMVLSATFCQLAKLYRQEPRDE